MLKDVLLTKRYGFHCPDTLGNEWEFNFTAEFTKFDDGVTMCHWSESSLPGGSFTIQDECVSWYALLEAWHELSAIAYSWAWVWNQVEARGEDSSGGERDACNTRQKVINSLAAK